MCVQEKEWKERRRKTRIGKKGCIKRRIKEGRQDEGRMRCRIRGTEVQERIWRDVFRRRIRRSEGRRQQGRRGVGHVEHESRKGYGEVCSEGVEGERKEDKKKEDGGAGYVALEGKKGYGEGVFRI